MADYFSDSTNKAIDQYLLGLVPERDPLLQKMEQYALDRGFPFIGPLSGQLLGMLARMTRAKTVFELGSGFGFSAVHFARAVGADGHVWCTDGDPENERAAKQFFIEAGLTDRVEFHVGDAVAALNKFDGPFDIVFMDIDKDGYPDGFRAGWPKVKKGGLFIADNLLWHGKVMTDNSEATTRGVRELTKLIHETPGAMTTILPLRDGVSVTYKLL